MNLCKIYKLTNLVNNKIYVGQTWLSFERRMKPDGSGYYNSPKLYNAIKKYGVENFEYSILYRAECQQEADIIEDYFIKKLASQNPDIGYNIQGGGRGGKHSEETIEKIRQSLIGREVSEETRKKISQIHKGLPKPKSEEFKEQVSESMKEWHSNNDHPLLGVPRTEEQKQAQREKLIGKPQPKEGVEKRKKILRERFKMTEVEELEIIRLYQENMLSYRAICEKLNINNRKIYRVFEKYNITPRNKVQEPNKKRWKRHNLLLENNCEQICNMYKFKTVYEVSRYFKTTRWKIYEILLKNSFKIKETSANKMFKEVIEKINCGESLKNICDFYELSETLVLIIKKYYKQ